MKTTRDVARLVLITGLLLATTLSAQGMRQQGREQQQIWLKFEKELGMQTRYAVDMEIQAMGMTMLSKIYRTEGKMRSEMNLPMMNMKIVSLELTENGKTLSYSLFPDKKKYCLNPADDDHTDDKGKLDYKLQDAGTEVYEGVTCKKRRMTVTLPDEGTQVMDMLCSPAQKNMPVKMTTTAKMKIEPDQPPKTITSVILFKNYKFGAPAATLFTIPKDYTQAANMQEIMMSDGGLFGGAQGQAGGGMTLPPEALKALQEAQAEAAKEAKGADAGGGAAEAEAMRQSLQKLRGLLGK
jgi:hypothetical protein